MKKSLIISALAGIAVISTSSAVLADSMPYEPVFEAVPITEAMNNAAQKEATAISTTKVTPVTTSNTAAQSTAASAVTSIENENLQNALLQFDGAQTEYRNQLIQYRNEYTELDNQYKILKAQRSQKAKQVKATERKIKNINALKEKTRKNMN